ncbi:MAG: zf-HC2 domain-containing protein [Gemmatimonadetes bacterium]|nr:zf-HC2 domain-containing protein [Gemmatimonadota bacterium]
METGTRHIPEDELHAYLDQALSRSQCVEIECHLATCRACHLEREQIASMRDRTTALLALAAPRRPIVAPAFAALKARPAAARRSGLATRLGLGLGLVAAGLGAAVVASQLFSSPAASGAISETVAVAPPVRPVERALVALGPVSLVEPDPAPAEAPPPKPRRPTAHAGSVQLVVSDPVVQVATLAPETEPFQLAGLWQSVDLRQAETETAGHLPKIDGLPIIDIQLQRGGGDQRPLIVIAQQHPSGRILRTIEGPMDRVEALLEAQVTARTSAVRASVPSMTPPDYVLDGASNARRGLRMLTVMGDLPADTLNALARAIEVR